MPPFGSFAAALIGLVEGGVDDAADVEHDDDVLVGLADQREVGLLGVGQLVVAGPDERSAPSPELRATTKSAVSVGAVGLTVAGVSSCSTEE